MDKSIIVKLLKIKYLNVFNFSHIDKDSVFSDDSKIIETNGDLMISSLKYGRYKIENKIVANIYLVLFTEDDFEKIINSKLSVEEFYKIYSFTPSSIVGRGLLDSPNFSEVLTYLPYVKMKDGYDKPTRSYFDFIKNKFSLDKNLIKFETDIAAYTALKKVVEPKYKYVLFIDIDKIEEYEKNLITKK